MNRLKNLMDKTLLTFSSFLLIMMVSLSIWQVLARYALNISTSGTEEITRYLLIWFGLMTAAYVFGAKKHIAILFFREKFNERLQGIFETITNLVIIILMAILMVYGGMKVVLLTSAQTAAATGISMGIVYASLPVCGLLIILYTVHSMWAGNKSHGEEAGS
ncbi:TRAP transporter small permease [Oceanobacillus massiliensis]|uniref:TRAP transporter small permease n=1 Tax=Oceanobacillus massiliensis TaxID=1465765 RepID=UPI0002882EB4|nr:TRAP transporter small permease [Oceanobacillus massiliensis]